MAGKGQTIQNRRTPRRIFEKNVGFLFRGIYDLTQGLQISEGGMLVCLPEEHQIGENLVVSFFFSGLGFAVIRSEIIYKHPREFYGMPAYGLKFRDLHMHHRRYIRNYISAKTQAEAEVEAKMFGD